MNYRLLSVMLCNAALLSAATALAALADGQPAASPQIPKAESAQTEPAKTEAADSAQVKANLPKPEAAKPEAKREDQRLDETVVTATKVGKKLGQIADAVTVVDEEEIKDSAVTDITDTLRYTPGVQFKRAGGAGQYVYTKLRGYGDGNFVMLIDGMKINDSMSTGGNFLSKFDPFLIGGVEVLKGPQSVLYGADSTAGVFSYTTKGGIEGQNVTLGAEYGSFDWKKGYGGLRGVKGNFRYSLNAVGLDTGTNIGKESFENVSPQIKLGWGNKKLDVEFSFLSTNSKWNYARLMENGNKLTSPSQLYAFQVPDPNRYNLDNYYLTTLNVKNQINSELRQRLMLGWYKMRRQSINLNDGLLGYVQAANYNNGLLTAVNDSSYTQYNYESSNYQIDYNLIWDKNFGSVKNTALLGTNFNLAEARSWGTSGKTSGRMDTKGIYFNDQLMLLDEALMLDAGVRYDFNSAFEDKATWKAGPMYTFKKTGTTIYANYGTSFRQPTMTNLYSPQYGNANIKPEHGWTVQGGVRQQFLDGRLFVEAAAWKSELKNVIIFQYFTYTPTTTGQYQNRDKQITDGAELAVTWNFYKGFTARGNYNYTESNITTNGVTTPTVQIARHNGTLGLEYKDDKMLMGVTGHYQGPRLRWNGDINQPDYFRFDLNGHYVIGKGITAYARINNLFNRRITEDPYLQPGISVIGGLRWDFDFAKGGSKAIQPVNSF